MTHRSACGARCVKTASPIQLCQFMDNTKIPHTLHSIDQVQAHCPGCLISRLFVLSDDQRCNVAGSHGAAILLVHSGSPVTRHVLFPSEFAR